MHSKHRKTNIRAELKERREAFLQFVLKNVTVLSQHDFTLAKKGAASYGSEDRLYVLTFTNMAGRAIEIVRSYRDQKANDDYVIIYIKNSHLTESSRSFFSLDDFIHQNLSKAIYREPHEKAARAEDFAYWRWMGRVGDKKQQDLCDYIVNMNTLMQKHLKEILSGRQWDDVPFSWHGYK